MVIAAAALWRRWRRRWRLRILLPMVLPGAIVSLAPMDPLESMAPVLLVPDGVVLSGGEPPGVIESCANAKVPVNIAPASNHEPVCMIIFIFLMITPLVPDILKIATSAR